MELKKFSIVEALRFAFYTVIENIIFFLALWLLCMVILFVGMVVITIIAYFPFLNTIIAFLKEHHTSIINKLTPTHYFQLDIRNSGALLLGTVFFACALQLLYRFLSLGITRINLDFYDYKISHLKQLFSGLPYLWRGIIAGFLYNGIVGIGLMLFIIPGIIFALKYGFYEQILVDKNVGILESLRQSARITQGAKQTLFGLLSIFFFINMIAMLFLGLGFLVAYPALLLAQTYAYRKLNAAPIHEE